MRHFSVTSIELQFMVVHEGLEPSITCLKGKSLTVNASWTVVRWDGAHRDLTPKMYFTLSFSIVPMSSGPSLMKPVGLSNPLDYLGLQVRFDMDCALKRCPRISIYVINCQ